ncbi:nucleotidyltransferase domain-containing protein [Dietzia cercidiphylli]|uniref:nucleotidyltransferase domain-containing protein n=1 Tax=Dietzia cercidiphylli TaxID=498199 RepID=UPI00223BE220|nr:nucleotidyltransferase [Dietzia cercidiphylli]MCT1514541.1 nucleotidyltransferase [Dietzia cercidiphylli]
MSNTTAQSVLLSVLKSVTPDDAARASAAQHRASIEDWLESDVGIIRMRETGSWHHGTALNIESDVDYFVTMPGLKSASSGPALETLRASLARGLTGCTVSIDRPAVRITYLGGGPAVEITPAYFRETDDYDIPDPDGTGWVRSNPAIHLDYVNKAQKATDGRAKNLIRLVKTWRTRNRVPLSSFYLEMRTAQYALGNNPIIYDWDLRDFFKSLHASGLRDMNDPTDYGRRITTGARSEVELLVAGLALDSALTASRLAREATENEDHLTAARHTRSLFGM